MAEEVPALLSPDEYLDFEDRSPTKHEYLGGVVHAMSGGTIRHGQISGNVFASLHAQLRGKSCFPINSDVKIRVRCADHTRFYYPDAGVVCESNPPDEHFQDQPVVLVEVLSPSSKRVDLTEKRDVYLGIPSLSAYLVIDPDRLLVAVDRKTDGGIVSRTYNELDDTISLEAIGCEITLAEMYERVFPEA